METKENNDCMFEKDRICIVSEMPCHLMDSHMCPYLHKAYRMGYAACERDDLFEGSGIGNYHNY